MKNILLILATMLSLNSAFASGEISYSEEILSSNSRFNSVELGIVKNEIKKLYVSACSEPSNDLPVELIYSSADLFSSLDRWEVIDPVDNSKLIDIEVTFYQGPSSYKIERIFIRKCASK